MSIHVQKALESQLEAGLHSAVVIKVSLKTRLGQYGPYTALNLVFSDEHGAQASAFLVSFRGKISTAFTALGKPINALTEIAPQELLTLRGLRALMPPFRRTLHPRGAIDQPRQLRRQLFALVRGHGQPHAKATRKYARDRALAGA